MEQNRIVLIHSTVLLQNGPNPVFIVIVVFSTCSFQNFHHIIVCNILCCLIKLSIQLKLRRHSELVNLVFVELIAHVVFLCLMECEVGCLLELNPRNE